MLCKRVLLLFPVLDIQLVLKTKDEPYIYSGENLKYLRQAIAQVEDDKFYIIQ